VFQQRGPSLLYTALVLKWKAHSPNFGQCNKWCGITTGGLRIFPLPVLVVSVTRIYCFAISLGLSTVCTFQTLFSYLYGADFGRFSPFSPES
jgi:hypothetical protein